MDKYTPPKLPAMPPIYCGLCTCGMTDFGGLIFSPPNEYGQVDKFHVCVECWTDLERTLRG